jgi:hypothetical protein
MSLLKSLFVFDARYEVDFCTEAVIEVGPL